MCWPREAKTSQLQPLNSSLKGMEGEENQIKISWCSKRNFPADFQHFVGVRGDIWTWKTGHGSDPGLILLSFAHPTANFLWKGVGIVRSWCSGSRLFSIKMVLGWSVRFGWGLGQRWNRTGGKGDEKSGNSRPLCETRWD